MGFTNEELKKMSRTVSKTKNKYQRYKVLTIANGCEYVSHNNFMALEELYKLCKINGYKWIYLGNLTGDIKLNGEIVKSCSLKTALKHMRQIDKQQGGEIKCQISQRR